jgi:surfeit locus 1 family protein
MPEPGNSFSPPNTPQRWYVRDVSAMAAALKAPSPAPLTLMAETSTNPQWKALTPAPIPADIANRHLEYAITWYGLAAALLGVYAALLLKRRKG